MDAVLEKKLRELIDRQEIWDVMLRYGRGLDRFDRAMVRSCYFDDAIEDHFNFVGTPDDFIEWALQTATHFVSNQHHLSNHTCELRGDDAYCETYYIYTGITSKGPHFMSTGRYVDHFQRRKGEWRIANRVCIVEGKYDVAASGTGTRFPTSYPDSAAQPVGRDKTDISYQRPPKPRAPRPPRMHE